MSSLAKLRIKIFADGADLNSMRAMYAKPYVKGLTTNPTLMRKAGVRDYRAFARQVLAEMTDKPICFEVLADDFAQMERQALEISGWAPNVYVKIPITNTQRQSSDALIKRLADQEVKINVTALTTLEQVQTAAAALSSSTASFVSIFAGRIADTGLDPVPIMQQAAKILQPNPRAELVWASSREIINIFQADAAGCPIITVTDDILRKLSLIDYDLSEYSLDTVKMFYADARRAGFSL
jgi:transaldolase